MVEVWKLQTRMHEMQCLGLLQDQDSTMREQTIGLVRLAGPVRSTSHRCWGSLLSARCARQLATLGSLQRCAYCTARTCTPREITVTHLRLQRGALPQ